MKDYIFKHELILDSHEIINLLKDISVTKFVDELGFYIACGEDKKEIDLENKLISIWISQPAIIYMLRGGYVWAEFGKDRAVYIIPRQVGFYFPDGEMKLIEDESKKELKLKQAGVEITPEFLFNLLSSAKQRQVNDYARNTEKIKRELKKKVKGKK